MSSATIVIHLHVRGLDVSLLDVHDRGVGLKGFGVGLEHQAREGGVVLVVRIVHHLQNEARISGKDVGLKS